MRENHQAMPLNTRERKHIEGREARELTDTPSIAQTLCL